MFIAEIQLRWYIFLYNLATLALQLQAWIEGIKDIMEPLLILLLAWALGAAIQVSDSIYLSTT